MVERDSPDFFTLRKALVPVINIRDRSTVAPSKES